MTSKIDPQLITKAEEVFNSIKERVASQIETGNGKIIATKLEHIRNFTEILNHDLSLNCYDRINEVPENEIFKMLTVLESIETSISVIKAEIKKQLTYLEKVSLTEAS